MVNWDDIKGKLAGAAEQAKKAFSLAADKTQKGARVASLRVKVVMEENKINKAMCELGRKAYDIIDKGEGSVRDNSQVKNVVSIIKASRKAIDKINEEIKAGK